MIKLQTAAAACLLACGLLAADGALCGDDSSCDRAAGLFRSQIHRGGGYNTRPDNALETFLWCWGLGVAPEADARLTKDGVAIALHDSTLARVGRGISDEFAKAFVGTHTWEELRDVDVGSYLSPDYSSVRISTMESVFAAMKGRPRRYLYVDEKGAPPELIADLARRFGVERQTCYTSSDYKLAKKWHEIVPGGETMVWIGSWPKNLGEEEIARVERHLLEKLGEIEQDGFRDVSQVQIHVHLDTRRRGDWFCPSTECLKSAVARLHAHGVRVQAGVWGRDSEKPEAYAELWKLGFDSFATDWPNEYMQWHRGVVGAEKPGLHARPLKVLAIGNSFSHSLMAQLPECAKALPSAELDFATLVIGGCSLERHWDNMVKSGDPEFRPYEVYWSFASAPDKGNSPFGDAVKEDRANILGMLQAAKWDIVTIQQASHASWDEKTYQPYADSLIAKIKELAPQAEIRVQQTWAYCNADERVCADATPGKPGTWGINQQGMHERLTAAYDKLAERHHLKVIPSGDAVGLYRKALPVTFKPPTTEEQAAAYKDGKLPDMGGEPVGSYRRGKGPSWNKSAKDNDAHKLRWDSIHLNKEGQYLQACTWLAALFDDDLSRLAYKPDFLSEEKAALMRKCAVEAVKARTSSGRAVHCSQSESIHGKGCVTQVQ